MATLIAPDGTRTEVLPASKAAFTLEELNALVGGWIEIIHVGTAMFVLNEEGKLLGLPVNQTATYLAQDVLMPRDCLCGSVLICDSSELE